MSIKGRLAQYVFSKATTRSRAKRRTVAISNAKTIGILYDATQPVEVNIIKKFAESLKSQGKIVTLFGFYNKKKSPLNFISSLSNEIISRSDLNWIGLPKKSTYAMMANEPFDMLLTLCTWHCLPLLVISASSKAKFRMGKYYSDAMHCFDFMVNVENNVPLENFLAQIQMYSQKMNG